MHRSLFTAEVRAANAANHDFQELPAQVDMFGAKLKDYYRGLNQGRALTPKQRYWTRRRERRTGMRVVADRYGRALMPNAVDVLNSNSPTVAELFCPGSPLGRWEGSEEAPRQTSIRNRELIFQSVITHLLLRDTVDHVFDGVSKQDQEVLLRWYERITRAERNAAVEYYEARFGNPIDIRLLEDPRCQQVNASEDERELAFIAGSLQIDLGDLLKTNNIPSQGEFMAVAMNDWGVGVLPERTTSALRHLDSIGALAKLTVQKADRFVFSSPEAHIPLWTIEEDGTVTDTCPLLSGNSSPKVYRCVGPDWLPASSSDHLARAKSFATTIGDMLGDQNVIDHYRLPATTVVAGFAVSVADHLGRLGILSA